MRALRLGCRFGFCPLNLPLVSGGGGGEGGERLVRLIKKENTESETHLY